MDVIVKLLASLTLIAASSMVQADTFTDGEILGISLATQEIQMRARDLVCPRIVYWDLKNLCNVLVNDNVGYTNALQGFIQQSGIHPVPSQRSREVEAEGKRAVDELIHLDGKLLDQAYLGYELKLHDDTLRTIREEFLPSVHSQQLGQMIQDIQPTMHDRLGWAQRIRQEMGP